MITTIIIQIACLIGKSHSVKIPLCWKIHSITGKIHIITGKINSITGSINSVIGSIASITVNLSYNTKFHFYTIEIKLSSKIRMFSLY